MKYIPLLIAVLGPAAFGASSPRNCIGSVPLATFQIKLSPGNGAAPLPIRVVNTKLDYLGEGLLFASADPGAVGTPGCTLQAAVDTESAGASEPVVVGRVVRLPRIESLTLTNETVDQGYAAVLKGRDLEAIEKTGWNATTGFPVVGPPLSVAGEGDRQTLRVVLPWPSPTPMAPVFVWLRGDKEGRAAPRR